MRHCLPLIVIALITSPAHAQKESSPEKVVLRSYRQLDSAQLIKKDRATMDRLMASDYLYVHSNGASANKAQDIAENLSATQQWTASKMDEVKVRIYGDVAVITGIQTLSGSAKGYVAGARRFTDIWVKREGRWQTIGGQSTLIPAK